MQETFVRVLAKPRRIEGDDRCRISCQSCATRSSRRYARAAGAADLAAGYQEARAVAPESASPAAIVATRKEVLAAIAALSDDQRDVLVAVDTSRG